MEHLLKINLILCKEKPSTNEKDQFLLDHSEINKKDMYDHMASIVVWRILQPSPKFISSSLFDTEKFDR